VDRCTDIRIGLELAKAFLAKDYKVIAAVRDPSTMPDLGKEMIVVKLDAGSKTDAAEVSAQGLV
jgi:NAD(P)-dependent dehydrogenase (short-subunit alcohol dehydrogenase family)